MLGSEFLKIFHVRCELKAFRIFVDHFMIFISNLFYYLNKILLPNSLVNTIVIGSRQICLLNTLWYETEDYIYNAHTYIIHIYTQGWYIYIYIYIYISYRWEENRFFLFERHRLVLFISCDRRQASHFMLNVCLIVL